MKHFALILMAVAALCSQAVAQNRVKNLYTYSKALNVEQLQQAAQPTQINRTLFAGYNTLCLPMSLTAEQLQRAATDVRVERFVAVRQEGDVLNLYFLDCTEEGIEAGNPYLIFSPTMQNLRARTDDALDINTQLHSVTMNDQLGNRVTFGSSWNAIQQDGRYGIPAKQDVDILQSILVRTDVEKTFLPTRCGVEWEAQAPGAVKLEIKHVTDMSGLETGIAQLKAKEAIVDVYDVKGTLVRKQVNVNVAMKSLPRGIYVIGGEKVAVK